MAALDSAVRGEPQLEMDRLRQIERKLEEVKGRWEQGRRACKKADANKSTLFSALTRAGIYAATVGFIRHLPHELIAAFRGTLQETCEAGGRSPSPRREENMEAV